MMASPRLSAFVLLFFTQLKGHLADPPSGPQNLTCQTNLTKPATLHCRWTPGSDTLIPTSYTFHTEIRSQMVRYNYSIPPGVNNIIIPRTEFPLYNKIQVYVKAQNALGQVTTPPLLLDPMEAAKLDPPRIEKVKPEPRRYGCLMHSWSLCADQDWVMVRLEMELLLEPVDSTVSDEEKVRVRPVRNKKDVELCGLLHGTEYQARIRVRYRQSPWSEWSDQARGSTLEKAPMGHLDTWLKVSEGQSSAHNTAELVWKPSKQFRANGRTVYYVVSLAASKICVTRESHCTFKIPKGAQKVYLTAVNPAGRSRPTEVPVYTHRALLPVSSLRVLPHGDTELLVEWSSPPASSPIGYVLECRQQRDRGSSFVSFHLLDRNQSGASVSGGIEPYTPYEISVYPKYKDGVGLPRTETAYSRQKAPSTAPTPKLIKIWYSQAELSWDEIPVTQRNGIIQGYQVFYWDEHGDTKVIEVKATERRGVLKDLKPLTPYKAFIMVSTWGGSLNGSTVTLNTGSLDAFGIVLIGIPACVGITLVFIFILLTSLTKHEWLKRFLWPKIPDPANSSIRKWSTAELLQDTPPEKNSPEPGLVFLSHLSVVDLTEKKFLQNDKDHWLCHDSESHLHSSQSSSPFDSDGTGEPVPYATLVFSGPYQCQPPHPTYLRSESTQPLLEEEEPQSPMTFDSQPYENILVQGEDAEHVFSECEENAGLDKEERQLWVDFPLLNSLAMNEV
ncbi:granulocyte colony-stimulating factor receptor [Clupea harengus]|uniref:Granulocyte colony-stimulating factor receptor n=1 Tax=Clupea harengus TaxID=7950 RepID=A0A6P8FW03_CLUHA|nr:granulocyte colony-stimulating factor receptor [Clupea harengus]XP_031432114.1 granulocyte colony-stimulating factor receptor [Clupea harengus]XP_042565021.1 granulocyte colony-stimulating factor receptor [Clupea harengus]XP_042565022.1 granulocyte colony-stimulating factor receptor [Clupea harengus]